MSRKESQGSRHILRALALGNESLDSHVARLVFRSHCLAPLLCLSLIRFYGWVVRFTLTGISLAESLAENEASDHDDTGQTETAPD